MKSYPVKFPFAFAFIFVAFSWAQAGFGKVEGVAITCSTQSKEGGEAHLYEDSNEPSTLIYSQHGSYGSGSFVYEKKINLKQFSLGQLGFVNCNLARWGNFKFNQAKWTCTFTQTQMKALTDHGFNVCDREN